MEKAPTVTLIGPGAIGLALAGGLVEAGTMPTIAARTPFARMKVTWPKGSLDVPVGCVTSADELSPTDVVIVATKATQNADVAPLVAAATAAGSILVIAQNGVDHLSRFPNLADGVEILPAIVMLPSERVSPGEAKVGKPSRLSIPAGPAADVVAGLFADSFVSIDRTDDWTTAAWFKLVLNAASGGMGVLTRRGADIYTDPDAQQLVLDLMEEVAMVGRAEGAELAEDLPAMLQQHLASSGRAGGHTSSIVVDRRAGIPTEWRERNEVVVTTAASHGIAVPLNQALVTLIRLGEPD